ncbi:heme exporter protein CcmD [Kordiimonas sp.]|uniref:heme exporter protein CcmD n=1 Tax=Kordiimonas sp. TaxID=1970157 RepID=UPI003A8E8B93
MDALDMGKHAIFIWAAYGVTFVSLIVLALLTLKAHRTAARDVERQRPKRQKSK